MIKKGDLVMVVAGRPCCGHIRSYGDTFIVADLEPKTGVCSQCGQRKSIVIAKASGEGFGYDTRRLKKIDPPASGELKGVPLLLKEPA